MKINNSFRSLRKTLDQHSPVVLTAMAVTGACATAWLAARGGYKAAQHMSSQPPLETLTPTEKFVHTYKFYAPAAVCLVGTSACMIMATKIGLDRTAAVAGAFVVAERANDQYRDKVKELLGQNKDTKVNDAVAADQVLGTATPQTLVIRESEQLFFDRRTGRYFGTTRNALDKAVNDFNQTVVFGNYASLNEFYKMVGLPEVQDGDELGWNAKQLVELIYTTVLKGDEAVVAFTFDKAPMPNFRRDFDVA